ncbi:MAG: tRNA (N6-isopentenyl adenosine(37)-C2)-methylthiotransferase MiaB [Clostridia bacterium]
MLNYFIHTYGCQMNIHESEKIAEVLREMSYEETLTPSCADIIVYNTCCIRETAESKILGNIGDAKKLKRDNPNLIIVICGCMTQQKGTAELLRAKYPYVDIILGTSNLHLLRSMILDSRIKRSKSINIEEYNCAEHNLTAYRTSFPNAWVNIIYGCNNFCTYCIVPYVRGRESSRKITDILEEVNQLLNLGYKEITLLGQNVNSYGHDLKDGTTFAQLLEEIGKISGKFRLRFMTSHPKDLTDDVIDVIGKYDNICNNIHLPVQSGSNDILKRMNRHYTRENYLESVRKIRERIPNVGISTDIMVGFPGETEQDFCDTLSLIEEVRYCGLFSFIYSRRKGTPAYSMDNQINIKVKTERIRRLIDAQSVITKELSDEMQGKTFEILVESVNTKYADTLCGRAENGRLVNFKSKEDLIGKFVDIKIKSSRSATLWGELLEE